MNIEDEARQAAQEYAQRHVGGMQPVETIGDRVRASFEAGAVWASEQADRGCGHPNHGAEDHDCAPFLPDREPSEDYPDAEGLASEQANREPSDAERGELANLIPLGFREQDGVRNVYDAADRILTAGFRKANREPSDAEVEAAGRGMYENRVSLIESEAQRRAWPTWAGLEKADSDEWRDAGRAALIAAQEVRGRG